jgi:hypothetical protein
VNNPFSNPAAGTFVLILLFLAGCNNQPVADAPAATGGSVHSNADDTLTTGNTPVVLNGCYEMILKQDTATLRIDLKDSTITGELAYHFKEKDRNNGTLKGVLRDRYIYADYTFASEGTTSVREVVFRIEGQTLVPGFGDITEAGNKIVFRDKAAIQYGTEHPFVKVSCVN